MTEQAHTENRLYLINRQGQGEAYYLLLNSDITGFQSHVLHAEKWPLCTEVTDFGIAAVDDTIYVVGGYDRKAQKCLKRVLRYNPRDGTWEERASLFLSRSNMAVCVVNGQIYVSGGQKTDGKTTATCELYDPKTDAWAKNGSLRAARADHVTVTVGSEIYCSGGRQGEEGRNNLWVCEDKKWEELDRHYPQKMDLSISGHVMAEIDNKLYITGGIRHDVDESGTSLNVTSGWTVAFNVSVPTLEASADIQILSPWDRHLPQMIHPRHNAGSIVLGGRLYVFGGSRTEDREEVRTAEYFDVKQQKWCQSFKFKKGKLGDVGCAVVAVTTRPDKPDSPTDFKWVLW